MKVVLWVIGLSIALGVGVLYLIAVSNGLKADHVPQSDQIVVLVAGLACYVTIVYLVGWFIAWLVRICSRPRSK